MKKIMISTFVLVAVVLMQEKVSAQENPAPETLFSGNKNINTENIGFIVAPAYAFTQMDGAGVSLFHLRGGITLGEKLAVGGFFNTSINDINPQSETLPDIYMDYRSVGGFLEYTLLSKKLFHLTFPLYIGGGEVQMDNESGDAGLGESNFFLLEPSALLEINLHQYVRFNIGGGYRIVGEMDYRNFDQSTISGLTGYAGLKFGLFR
ncbi:hypothetical protein WJR50_28460 [Catalinimonas sp. 4WD22]|uniref:hypothetical protein n=1 Tax=Catalinimonas locisalis TaxID=3133978 RepID=UPI00310183CE